MNLRIRKKLLSVAVSAGLGAVSLPVLAAPTVYGDLAVAYHSESYGTSALSDNVSLLGVKGDGKISGDTKYFYDFNFILDTSAYAGGGNPPFTHLGVIGVEAPWGTVSMGRDNGIFNQMVDGSTYQQNWFYTPGMSAFQVGGAMTYKSPMMSGFQVAGQVFGIDNGTSQPWDATSTAIAASYAAGPLTFGVGSVSYPTAGPSLDVDQFGQPQDSYDGTFMKSKIGFSAGYKTGPFGVVLAYDSRSPIGGGSDHNATMLTGSYAVSSKTTLVANYSSTSISGTSGTIFTLMASYAPSDATFLSAEYQSSDSNANAMGLTGSTGGVGATSAFALGYTVSF